MNTLTFFAAIVLAAPPEIVATPADPVTLVTDMPAAGAIAVKPTGQAALVIDGAGRTVEIFEPSLPVHHGTAITRFAPGEQPVAVACVDSVTAAVVVRAGRAWTLRTFRLGAPGEPADSAAPLQTIVLGESAEVGDSTVRVVVSPSRNWLLICGLPAPMDAVVRAPIAGSRIGSVTTRHCPTVERSVDGPPAATISPGEELLIFHAPADGAGEGRGGHEVLSMYSPVGTRRLLELDTGLPGIRGACHARESLWVIAGDPRDDRRPEGLWRLEATLENQRQAIRPVCVAKFAAPVAVAALSANRILVVHGEGKRVISMVEP